MSLVTIGAAVAMAAAGCVSSGGGGGGGGAAPAGQGLGDRHVGAGERGHGRPGGGRLEGGHAQRHRAAARLGQLRQHLKAFTTKYGIKVNSANPDGSSQDEINAVKQLRARTARPTCSTSASPSPHAQRRRCSRPTRWPRGTRSPRRNKDPNGAWFNDYGGYISIGCNTRSSPTAPTTFADLLKPEYKGKVALNGDPTQAAAAFAGVWAAALANGGSLDNIQPGIDFLGKVAKAGNC